MHITNIHKAHITSHTMKQVYVFEILSHTYLCETMVSLQGKKHTQTKNTEQHQCKRKLYVRCGTRS
jgi:hypothetical protein